MSRNTSVSLDYYFESFVDSRVSQGRFKNASEVIRAGLRLLEEEENKIVALKKAIEEGINSGIAESFNPKEHLEVLKAKKKKIAKFFFTNKAVEDLSKIWDYTYEVWSENQADKYYYSILDYCQELAQNPLLGKQYAEIGNELLGYKSGNHIIFYRVIKANEIEIVRILHNRMDLKNRIQE